MKTKLKVTPHTIFIYNQGNFLRVVRGEHFPPETNIKPRVYHTVKDALKGESRKKKILKVLNMFPSDQLIDRRLKRLVAPVKLTGPNKKLSEAVKSKLFLFAQMGYDKQHKEVAYVYHRNPMSPRGLTMVSTGPVVFVQKLIKKYKKPPIRDYNYRERVKS